MSCSHAHQHLLEKIDASTAVDAYHGCLRKGVNGEEIQREIQLKVEELSRFFVNMHAVSDISADYILGCLMFFFLIVSVRILGRLYSTCAK